ncbi:MAG TPA: AAA family ATPase, partial [Ktedonobacteraceae bacterium]|nr:AAA family ATPase [Ktedonobacteraceae bacterium]
MKITVRNLGPIRNEATFDLKPLTVFIGQNDSGKTWLAYVMASIFGPYGMEKYIQTYIEGLVPQMYEPLHRAIEQVLVGGSTSIDIRQFAVDYGEAYFNDVAALAKTWMDGFLSTQLLRFDDLDISLQLAGNTEEFINAVVQSSQVNKIAVGPAGALLTLRKRRGEDKLFVYTSNEIHDTEEQEEQGINIGGDLPPDVVKEQIVSFVLSVLHRSLYPYVRIFPIEKATLVTDRFSERIIEHTKINEAVQNTFYEVIWPVQSFVTMLSLLFNVGRRQQEEREKRARNDVNVRKYREFAELLEQEVLMGEIKFSTPEPDPRRQILYQPSPDAVLEIPIASSMVKELSPLVLYLRYLARPGELLIIDEPEMNLHPAAQVKIIEFLTMLVNAGLNILITTHSSYVVDHLINLMDAY